MRVVGLDPGLRFTGWGCVDVDGGAFIYRGHGVIAVPSCLSVAERLAALFQELKAVLGDLQPNEVAVEEVFVNHNGTSTMKLCMARGVVLLVPATLKIPVYEYGANCIKKTITGNGHATKDQVKTMVEFFLPKFRQAQSDRRFFADCSDALAMALCHAQHLSFAVAQERAMGRG